MTGSLANLGDVLIREKMEATGFNPQSLFGLANADPIVAAWLNLWMNGYMQWVEMLEACQENLRSTIDAQLSSPDLAVYPETLESLKGYISLLESFEETAPDSRNLESFEETAPDSRNQTSLQMEAWLIHRVALTVQIKNVVFAALLDIAQKAPILIGTLRSDH